MSNPHPILLCESCVGAGVDVDVGVGVGVSLGVGPGSPLGETCELRWLARVRLLCRVLGPTSAPSCQLSSVPTRPTPSTRACATHFPRVECHIATPLCAFYARAALRSREGSCVMHARG